MKRHWEHPNSYVPCAATTSVFRGISRPVNVPGISTPVFQAISISVCSIDCIVIFIKTMLSFTTSHWNGPRLVTGDQISDSCEETTCSVEHRTTYWPPSASISELNAVLMNRHIALQRQVLESNGFLQSRARWKELSGHLRLSASGDGNVAPACMLLFLRILMQPCGRNECVALRRKIHIVVNCLFFWFSYFVLFRWFLSLPFSLFCTCYATGRPTTS